MSGGGGKGDTLRRTHELMGERYPAEASCFHLRPQSWHLCGWPGPALARQELQAHLDYFVGFSSAATPFGIPRTLITPVIKRIKYLAIRIKQQLLITIDVTYLVLFRRRRGVHTRPFPWLEIPVEERLTGPAAELRLIVGTPRIEGATRSSFFGGEWCHCHVSGAWSGR